MPSALNSATQAQQEAGTTSDAFVTPLRQQYHSSSPKLWVMYNPAGVISEGYNVFNIQNVGTGDNIVHFTMNFLNVTYCPWACARVTSVSTNVSTFTAQIADANFVASNMRVQTSNGTNTLADCNFTFAAILGDE